MAGFAVRNADGSLKAAGILVYKQLHGAVQATIKVLTDDAAAAMMRDKPAGGFRIVDDFAGGLIEIFCGELDFSLNAITSVFESLRDKFDIPIADAVKEMAKWEAANSFAIEVKPNPTRS